MTATDRPKVYICILSWNRREEVLACLDALRRQDYPNLRILVVDNGSTDGSVEALRAFGGTIDLIEHETNLGFTGGCNAGMRHVLAHGGDYIWLLNTDTECAPDTLSILVEHAERRPELGMVSPVICFASDPDRVQYAIGRLDLATGQAEETHDPEQGRAMQRRQPDQIMLIGTALLIKRAVLQRVGLLDDRFFAYCEDNDYSVRVTAAGFQADCVWAARVMHAMAPPEPGRAYRKPYAFYYMVRNGILFWRKHARGLAAWRFARWHACTILRVLGRGGFGQEEVGAFCDGIWSGIRGGTGRWDQTLPAHRMPGPVRALIVAMPALWLGIMEASPRAILRALHHPAGVPRAG